MKEVFSAEPGLFGDAEASLELHAEDFVEFVTGVECTGCTISRIFHRSESYRCHRAQRFGLIGQTGAKRQCETKRDCADEPRPELHNGSVPEF